MCIVVEPTCVGECRAQRIFTGMTERRMAEIVRQAQSLGQVFVEAERAGHRPADLRDFEAVCQADAIMVAVRGNEHLRLMAEATECDRLDQPVAVTLKDVARATRADAIFVMEPPARR